MPTCHHHPPNFHNHIWPTKGPLVICPGERTCGYCTGQDANFDHQSAQTLRKHVYHEHTDGGKLDMQAVEVMMYKPDEKRVYRKKIIDSRGVECFRGLQGEESDEEDYDIDDTPYGFLYPRVPTPELSELKVHVNGDMQGIEEAEELALAGAQKAEGAYSAPAASQTVQEGEKLANSAGAGSKTMGLPPKPKIKLKFTGGKGKVASDGRSLQIA